MTHTTFTIPSHWIVKPFGGTLSSMQLDADYQREMVRIYEKANEFYHQISGKVGEVDTVTLHTACLVFSYEALVPETATASWKRFLKKEATKFRKKLKLA